MMHAYACSTCNLISTCIMSLLKNPIIQMTSLMHHYNTPRTRMRSPDQCSLPHPPPHPFASLYYGLLQQKVPAGFNGHTKCAYTRTTYEHLYDYGVTCMSVLDFVHIYNGIQSDVDQHNTQHEWWMIGSMYVYMHLVFKGLTDYLFSMCVHVCVLCVCMHCWLDTHIDHSTRENHVLLAM